MEKSKSILVLLKIFKGDLNPFDECALESALSFPDARVIALAMSPLSFMGAMEQVSRLGCEVVMVSDPLFSGSDTIATTNILAKAVEEFHPDLIFAGRKSMDGNTSQVPLMLAEALGFDLIQGAMSLKGDMVQVRSGESFALSSRQIITFEKFAALRSPSIFSQKKEVTVLDNGKLGLELSKIGQNGSKTKVVRSFSNQEDRRFCHFVSYDELGDLIVLSLAKGKEKKTSIPSIEFIHYVGDIQEIASTYGKKAIRLDYEGKSVEEIAKDLLDRQPKLVLWEESEAYKFLACQVAYHLGIGLCADCTGFRLENGQIIITRPALGGDVMADIVCTSTISMATVRKEDEECDVAFTVGKGALGNLERISALAKRLGAKMYCTRPLADMGVIDYKMQVGLTGISISPKVVVSIGTSGAVQHIVGIHNAKTIIAINCNRKEAIFDYADYGIVMDAETI